MNPPLFLIHLAMILLAGLGTSSLAALPRAWTVGNATVQAEYISSTTDTVTLRRADGQALRLNLAALSEADRAFVSQKQAEEKEANMVDAVLRGEIVWRLPYYSSLSWSSHQPAEILLWDEQNRKPGEKVASLKVPYVNNQRNRNQFEGAFKTEKPVRIPRNGRVVVKAMFDTVVNGKPRNLEELSVPMPLPPMTKGEIKLPAVRLTIAR